MNPIQTELVDHNGTRCEFCTPGMVMSMYTLLANNPKPPERDIEDAFDGNLCRCTGYSIMLFCNRIHEETRKIIGILWNVC